MELRRRYGGATIFIGLALIAVVALAVAADMSTRGYATVLIGLLVGYLALHLMINKLREWRPQNGPQRADGNAESAARRRFLGLTLGLGAIATFAAVASRVLLNAAGAVSQARSRFQLPRATKPAEPVPAGANLDLRGLTPYVTANDDFYRIDTALQVPVIDPDEWTLKITGMVENEVTDQLRRPVRQATGRAPDDLDLRLQRGGWRPDRQRALARLSDPASCWPRPGRWPGSDMVLSTSDDGFTAGTPLSALTDPDREAILAIGMNGEPLPIEHGFPVRMVVPGLYGYVSATKWVTELKVTTFEKDQGYWTPLGWSANGPIKIGLPDRCAAARYGRRRHCRGGRCGLGPAHGHRQGRGADRPGRLAGRTTRRHQRPGHLAAMALRMAGHGRHPPDRRAGDRRGRKAADRRLRPARS